MFQGKFGDTGALDSGTEGILMLTLTRKVGQSIQIGDFIIIKVVDIDSSNRVKIGIEAPLTVKILRTELVGT